MSWYVRMVNKVNYCRRASRLEPPCAPRFLWSGLLTPQVDRQALAPLIVEGEENDGPLDRRRLAHGLDVASIACLQKFGRPPPEIAR